MFDQQSNQRKRNLPASCQLSAVLHQWQTRPVTTMNPIRVAVLGVGSLGKEHARSYAGLVVAGQVELTGVFDTSADTARKIAAKHGARVFSSIAELAAASDAVNIVTPDRKSTRLN